MKDHGDPLAGHTRYRKLQDLSSGAFGFVQVSTVLQTFVLAGRVKVKGGRP